MDWGRAKNIILIVLLITNIFLIGVYGLRYGHSKESNSELYSYTIDKLKANQIELACDMPKSPGKIPALIVQYEEYDKNAVEKAIRDIENSSGNPKEKRPEDQSEDRKSVV